MFIKLGNYEVQKAIEAYVSKTMGSNANWDKCYIEMFAEVQEPIRKEKKHKNGKPMKNEYGHTIFEIDGYEKKSVHLCEMSEIEIYIENGEEEETS